MTELQYTAYVGDLEWLQELFSAGADDNAVDHGGMSALHWAADMGSVDGPREEISWRPCSKQVLIRICETTWAELAMAKPRHGSAILLTNAIKPGNSGSLQKMNVTSESLTR